ncbi:hypothetical protein [Streptomyces canus]|uniref:hypothetical protein n=1 Tax=Streptomyces canus TaxID=58343 RepID=UPI002E3466D0|nr:hypothetical protein [Streptomyces canus]
MRGRDWRASTAEQGEDRRLDRPLGGRPPEVPVFAQPGERGADGPPLLEGARMPASTSGSVIRSPSESR